jgi:hypothetical protein
MSLPREKIIFLFLYFSLIFSTSFSSTLNLFSGMPMGTQSHLFLYLFKKNDP